MERYLKKERESAKTFGVVVFILDREGRVYTAREEEEDAVTGKKPGDYSVICEKRSYHENWPINLWRGIQEETGIPDDKMTSVIDFGDYRIWETQFKDKVWSTVVVLKCPDAERFMDLVGTCGEKDGVTPIGFLPREEFEKLQLREGVRTILDNFSGFIFSQK